MGDARDEAESAAIEEEARDDTDTEALDLDDVLLTPAQDAAVQALVRHLRSQGPGPAHEDAVGSLTGPAGSGKTVILRQVVQRLGGEDAVLDVSDSPGPSVSSAGPDRTGSWDGDDAGEGTILVVAPTNRGARQLRRAAGCPASTIHRAIFRHRPMLTDAGVRLKQELEALGGAVGRLAAGGDPQAAGEATVQAAALRVALRRETKWLRTPRDLAGRVTGVLIDEASLVGGKLLAELRGVVGENVPVVLVGDPYQLAPVEDQDVLSEAAVLADLKHVHRHAGRIREFCDHLRGGGGFANWRVHPDDGAQGLAIVPRPVPLPLKRLLDATDVILVGRHDWRRQLNVQARRARFDGLNTTREPLPVPGDRLVVKSNHLECGICNGDMVELIALALARGARGLAVSVQPLDGDNRPEGPVLAGLPLDRSYAWPDYQAADLGARPAPPAADGRVSMDYAYGLTAHAAQGGEWGRVGVLDVPVGDVRRWRYTAASRAQNRLIVLH
jgi:hypothetical protein